MAGLLRTDQRRAAAAEEVEDVLAEKLPKALVKWYDYTKWVLDRVDGFPKNQRFLLGARLADTVLEVMELLAEAAYARGAAKADLLARVNRQIESVRWLVRICNDRNVISTPMLALGLGIYQSAPEATIAAVQTAIENGSGLIAGPALASMKLLIDL